MKLGVLLLPLLQALGCTGVPLYNPELESLADRGLQAALAEVNSAFGVSHLYRATRGSVTRSSSSCSTRVRLSAASTQVVSLRCSPDSSSSSESSEEVYTRRRLQLSVPFVNTGPAPSAPPAQPGGSFQGQTVDVRPRGDAFSNYLE